MKNVEMALAFAALAACGSSAAILGQGSGGGQIDPATGVLNAPRHRDDLGDDSIRCRDVE